jgi:hypothetical protein
MLDIINQTTISNLNQKSIYVPFETIFTHECQETQKKNSFNPISSLGFNLRCLKIKNYSCVKRKQFCKGLSKGLI